MACIKISIELGDSVKIHFSWSFGIVLWEIFTLGGTPYPSLPTENLLDFLTEGNRMAQPHNCPDKIYTLMRECWKMEPELRPPFSALAAQLGQYLEDNVRKVCGSDHNNINMQGSIKLIFLSSII